VLFRALLISLLIHAIFLLGPPAGRGFTRLQGPSVGVRGVLKARGGQQLREGAAAPGPMTSSRSSGHLQSTPKLLPGRPMMARASQLEQPVPEVSSTEDLDEVNDDALRQYRLKLARAASQFLQSRALAGDYAHEGEVLVQVRLEARSPIAGVALGASSGDRELDSAALAMVTRAVRVAPIPEGLRGRSLVLALPIRYSAGEE